MSAVKVLSLTEAVAWRNRTRGTVVMTNGVFDLVHPGHVRVLETARGFGDRLIVAVNSDQSVRQLGKGPDRPIVDATARTRIVAAFGVVDCVVTFDEPTPCTVVEALRPDVLVKGEDYDGQTLPGEVEVLARGGEVRLVPCVPGFSTTSMVERIRDTT